LAEVGQPVVVAAQVVPVTPCLLSHAGVVTGDNDAVAALWVGELQQLDDALFEGLEVVSGDVVEAGEFIHLPQGQQRFLHCLASTMVGWSQSSLARTHSATQQAMPSPHMP